MSQTSAIASTRSKTRKENCINATPAMPERTQVFAKSSAQSKAEESTLDAPNA